MKRPLTIAMILIVAAVLLYACSSTIRTATTSFVTVTIGGPANTALLKAEAATPLARFKYYLANAKWMPEAYAYIPSVVQVIVVTVTAPDIATPIVGVSDVKAGQTSATVRIEVPNGSARQFKVEGIRGTDSKTYYLGSGGPLDLNGAEVTVPISMAPVGLGIIVDTLNASAVDTTGCGTAAIPCKTITFALTQTTGTDAIYVNPGTYLPAGAGPGESFPLQLRPGNALICTGPTLSTIISGPFGLTMISGSDNASVDNCFIKVGSGGVGVDDQFVQGIPKATRINGSAFELPSGATSPTRGVLLSHDKSVLLDSTLTGTNVLSGAFGALVLGGKPSIIGNIISGLMTGVDLTATAGDAAITSNHVFGNTTAGINIATAAKPSISGNTIENNGTGITVNLGSPLISTNAIQFNFKGIEIFDGNATITSNSIDHNNAYGVYIAGSSTANAKINNNNIFCNSTWDVYILSALATIDLQDNAWDHDAGTNPPGPLVSDTGGGLSSYDIVFSSPTPTPLYDRVRPAVPGGCVPIPIQ